MPARPPELGVVCLRTVHVHVHVSVSMSPRRDDGRPLRDRALGQRGRPHRPGLRPGGLPGFDPERVLQQLLARVNADTLVGQDAGHFDPWGPDLLTVDAFASDRSYEPRREDLARVLGTPAPYWPTGLIQPEEMDRWRPGTPPPAVPPRHPALDTAPLDRLHRDQPGTPADRAVLRLAGEIDAQAVESAQIHIEMLEKCFDRQSIALAATVLEPAPANEPVEATLRAGWAEILHRTDALARDCVALATDWDGGRYFSFSTTTLRTGPASSTCSSTTSRTGRQQTPPDHRRPPQCYRYHALGQAWRDMPHAFHELFRASRGSDSSTHRAQVRPMNSRYVALARWSTAMSGAWRLRDVAASS
ncbi:hypothetical protein [Nonomuraea sp. NPDC049695]|uniref:hypothetical protein n=1 Tax=Nonomuraea sp. NPDC049695 TaxID=3154734 RepID=UPI003430FE47